MPPAAVGVLVAKLIVGKMAIGWGSFLSVVWRASQTRNAAYLWPIKGRD